MVNISCIGKNVKIVSINHPHHDETGVISEINKTVFGSVGIIIKLDDCPHGTESCFIFDVKDIRLIK